MKIAVISTPVFPCPPLGYSGLEMLAWQRAEGLAKKGHEVTLFAPEGSRCDFATLFPIGPPGTWDERTCYSKYWEELLKFDAIIDETWNKWSYVLKAEGRLKAPVLGVCHAPVDTMYKALPPVERPCFVAISKDQANHFHALFNREAKVAYNGVDLDYYKPMEGVKRSSRFLFLARFSTIKGPDLAIEACRQAGVGLDLVGDTSITNEPEYLEQCKKLCDGVRGEFRPSVGRLIPEPEIIMQGPATRAECVWWFSQAHCLLHPNQRFREPFGLAPVEAMACGCPVIAWDNGAMRETVGANKEVGALVKSLDEMINVINNNKNTSDVERMYVSGRCREWVGQFSVQRMIERYEELCREAVETGGW